MMRQANFKDSAVKLTQKRAIPLTAAVLVKISRALTLGIIEIIRKVQFIFNPSVGCPFLAQQVSLEARAVESEARFFLLKGL